jgi:hypothetical protein
MVGGKERVLTAAGIEATQTPLIGHHQLTLGLLRANLLGLPTRGLLPIVRAAWRNLESVSSKVVAFGHAIHYCTKRF